ncbi:hypothetical protein N8500_04730 [Candidatus Puniceispirillum sp.]|nr:hypothetical protein [Candidatus Puniceispirillum sp.]
MGEIIQLDRHRANISEVINSHTTLSDKDTYKIEKIRDSIEIVLEDVATDEKMPLTVAMAAGRYAAMRLFQLQGRAETMAFMDQCIITAELCDDLTRQLDEDA